MKKLSDTIRTDACFPLGCPTGAADFRSVSFILRILIGTVLVSITMTCAVAGAAQADHPSRNIRVYSPSQPQATTWMKIAAHCCELTDDVIGAPASSLPRVTLRFVSEDTTGRAPHRFLDMSFSEHADYAEICHALFRALISRRYDDSNGSTFASSDIVACIAAGLTHRLMFSRWSVLGFHSPDFETARLLFQEGSFPSLSTLITEPLEPDAGLFYHLYALHCDLFLAVLQSVEKTGHPLAGRLLTMKQHGRDTMEGVEYVLTPFCENGETFEKWYRLKAEKVSRKGRRLNSAERIAERIRDLETVPAVATSLGQVGCTRIPLEDVPEKLKAYKLDKGGVRALQHDLYEITKDAPFSLRAALTEYMRAFQLLEKGKIRKFRKQLRSARKLFLQAVSKQTRLEAYLDEMEASRETPESGCAVYTEVARRHTQKREALDPALYRYLNQLEQ